MAERSARRIAVETAAGSLRDLRVKASLADRNGVKLGGLN